MSLLILDGKTEKEYANEIKALPPKEKAALMRAWRAKARDLMAAKEQEQEQEQETPTQPGPEAQEPETGAPTPTPVPTINKDEYAPISANLTPVPFDIEGWRGTAYFDLDARWDAFNTPIDRTDIWGYEKRCMVMCPRIVWENKNVLTGSVYPPAEYPDLETYKVLGRRAVNVAIWILNEGVSEAIKVEAGNSSAR